MYEHTSIKSNIRYTASDRFFQQISPAVIMTLAMSHVRAPEEIEKVVLLKLIYVRTTLRPTR